MEYISCPEAAKKWGRVALLAGSISLPCVYFFDAEKSPNAPACWPCVRRSFYFALLGSLTLHFLIANRKPSIMFFSQYRYYDFLTLLRIHNSFVTTPQKTFIGCIVSKEKSAFMWDWVFLSQIIKAS